MAAPHNCPESPESDDDPAEVSSRRFSHTDSPWFWLSLFSWFALVGLMLIGPKYYQRLQRLEQKQSGRAASWMQRSAEGQVELQSGQVEHATPAVELDSLAPRARWRLGLIGLSLALVFAASTWKWRREAIRARTDRHCGDRVLSADNPAEAHTT